MFTGKRCTAAHTLVFLVLTGFNFRKSNARWMDLKNMDGMQSSVKAILPHEFAIDVVAPGIIKAKDGIWVDTYLNSWREYWRSKCRGVAPGDCIRCSHLIRGPAPGVRKSESRRYWAVDLGEITDISEVALMNTIQSRNDLAKTEVYTSKDKTLEEMETLLNNKDYKAFQLCGQLPITVKRSQLFHLVCPAPAVKWVILKFHHATGSVSEVGVQQGAYDECLHNFCLNNATCTDLTPGFSCTCQPGFTGIYCQIDIND